MTEWTLERLLPEFDKRERHSRWIAAPQADVWNALTGLRTRDLAVTRALLRSHPANWIRGGMAGALDARALDSMPPCPLAFDPPNEVVLGDISRYASLRSSHPSIERDDPVAFAEFADPGWSKVAMNFRLTRERGGTLLATETRVRATDERTRRVFAIYWLLVRAGSGLVRRDILRAIERNVRV